ncbi:MAG: hypothetical protein U9Q72_00095 [Patescibacteria group bacterium]|nr:hypothetical protein [Patescibacteria group bacterium]
MGEWMAKALFLIAVATMVLMIVAAVVKTWRKNSKEKKIKGHLLEGNIIF